MAELVKAFGTSHSPALNSTVEDYHQHADIDRGASHWKRTLMDKDGNVSTFEELIEKAPDWMADAITDKKIGDRVDKCQENIARMAADVNGADLDALIIIGDDQQEQYFSDNMPAFIVYHGETIRNTTIELAEGAPQWWQRARSQYHEEDGPKDYPVASELSKHMIDSLLDQEFDISVSDELRFERGESHSFGFYHRRLANGNAVPIVPISQNTYYPPNQPRPKRCYDFGRAIRQSVESWKADAKVGIMASGGLSHFTIDEELDRGVMKALEEKDKDALISIPLNKLNTGNSEIRNWITVAGAAEDLEMVWSDYVPCYRSLAGTGCAMAFAVWS